MSSDPHRVALGAYVLGALDPSERAEVDAHLPHCAECRDELAGLAALPGLLGRVSEAVALAEAPAPAADDALLERVLAAAVAERRHARRRNWFATAGATVAAAAAAATFFAWPSSTHATRVSATSTATHVHMVADLKPDQWGTTVTLWLTDVPSGERCQLIAVSRDGHREVAATWQASYAGKATVTGATSIPAKSIAALDVVTLDGQQLVNVPVSA